MSEQIQPGTPVRVVIEGTVDHASTNFLTIPGERFRHEVVVRDPAVTVTPLDPERPTLREIERAVDARLGADAHAEICGCVDASNCSYGSYIAPYSGTHAVLEALVSEFPGLIR